MHDKLLTNEDMCRRNMTTCDFCPRWDIVVESIMHNLQDCEEVIKFWTRIFCDMDIKYIFVTWILWFGKCCHV